jgi:hypothetical protein
MKNLTKASVLCSKSSAIWWWSGSTILSIDLTEDNDKILTHLHTHTHTHIQLGCCLTEKFFVERTFSCVS